MKFFDIHSHLNLSPLKERQDEIIKTLNEKEVGTITVGVDFKTSKEAVEVSQKWDNLFACVGFHPTETLKQEFEIEKFKDISSDKKVVAIGECGLDYFRIDENNVLIKQVQKEIFEKQIDLALELNLPLILHVRPTQDTMDAYEDVLDILEKKNDFRIKGDVHFFVGTPEVAQRFLNLGFHLSFTGVVTFARDYDEVIRMTPVDRILTETDAPFVSPVPYRGGVCEPWMVEEVVKKIAEIKGLEIELLREQIIKNTKNLFGL